MTVQDIYEQSIKPMAAGDRAVLANLILEDLTPEPPNTFRNENELIAMLEEGMKGSPIPVTAETWAELDRLIDGHTNAKQ